MQVEIAAFPPMLAGLAFSGNPDAGAFLDAGRDFDLDHLRVHHVTVAETGLAGAVANLAATPAGEAGSGFLQLHPLRDAGQHFA